MPDQSLEEIVGQAVKDAPAQLEETSLLMDENGKPIEGKAANPAADGKPKAEEKKEEDKGGEEEEKDDLGLTKQDQLEARQLLAALRDPNKSGAIIDFLAKSNGYKKGEDLTKKEEKVLVKSMVEELKEALGPELEYLADKMGPVFEKHINSKAEELTRPIQEKVDQQILEREQKSATDSINALGKAYFEGGEIPENLVSEMSTIMDRMKPTSGQSMHDYMEEVLFVAAGKKGVALSKTSKSKAEKILKNRNDAPARLASEGTRSPAVGEKTVNPRQQMTLDDAVRQAVESAKASVQ